jgi:serine/threonine-protein kinase
LHAAPLKLTIRLDGYEPYEIVQGPSDSNVRASAGLVRLKERVSSAVPSSIPDESSKAVGQKPHQTPAKNAPHRVPSAAPPAAPDIRLER